MAIRRACLPPTLILVASDEALRDDVVVRRAERLRAAGCDVELELCVRMFHVWHMFARILPEARAAIARIGAFFRTRSAFPRFESYQAASASL
jgi:monoterpene epsilon-lactone hydrolase